jgi:hypothetical protein
MDEALQTGVPEQVRALIAEGFPATRLGIWQARNEQTLDVLLAAGARINPDVPENLLKDALSKGKFSLIWRILEAGHRVPLGFFIKLLEYARLLGSHRLHPMRSDPEMVADLFEFALMNEPEVGRKDYGGALLKFAAWLEHGERSVARLLELGADPQWRGPQGQTALHVCTTPANARLLLAAGADLEARDDYGKSPLAFSVFESFNHSHKMRLNVWKVLVDAGADVKTQDKNGQSIDFGEYRTVLLARAAKVEARAISKATPKVKKAKADEPVKKGRTAKGNLKM